MTQKLKIIVCILLILAGCFIFNKTAEGVSNYSQARGVWLKPGYDESAGIKLLYNDIMIKKEIAGKKCVATDSGKGNNFIVFDVDDSFIFNKSFNEVILTIEYFDIGTDTFAIQYDSGYLWPNDGAFKRAGRIIKKQDTRTWKTYTTRVRCVKFANRQGCGPAQQALLNSGGGDFRINNRSDGDEYVSYVSVSVPFMTIAENNSCNIFSQKENIPIVLNIYNREDNDILYKLMYKITDLDGETVSTGEYQINVSKNTIQPYEIKTKIAKNGVFFAYIGLYKKGKLIEDNRTSFAICPEYNHETSFESRFGITAFFLEEDSRRLIKTLKRLGISWVRHDFRPSYAQTQSGKFNWEKCDLFVSECYRNGINICGTFLEDNTSGVTTGSGEAIKGFRGFISHVAYRYKDKIKYWEIWNEPDLWGFWPSGPNAANYTKLLKASYEAIKAINEPSKVIIGGLGGGKNNRFWFLDHIYKEGGGNYFDIAAIHPYTESDYPEKNNTLERKINDAVERMNKNGGSGKKIFITEIGWSTYEENKNSFLSLKNQANFLVRGYVIALSNAAVDKVFLHCFKNQGSDPEAFEQNFGIINNDFTPRPAAIAYANMIDRIEGLRYSGRLDLRDPLRGYIFENENKRVFILWSLEGKRSLGLPVKSKTVEIVDLMGNSKKAEPKKLRVRLDLTESPIFLEEH